MILHSTLNSSSPKTLPGEAVQLVKINGENSFELDEKALERILLDSRVRDSKVMVVSVTGDAPCNLIPV